MVQKFDFQPLDLQGAYRIKPFYATDNRGGLIKDYNVDTFRANGIDHDLKEVFYTISKRGVRGSDGQSGKSAAGRADLRGGTHGGRLAALPGCESGAVRRENPQCELPQ